MLRPLLPLLLLASVGSQAGESGQQPRYLLEIPESVGTILIAESDTSTLHFFHNAGSGLGETGASYMSIGQNGVGKTRPWDGKTPLGIYFVSERLDTRGLHEKYGPLAFPLDYPNIWDRTNGRGGDGIWIHGVTPGSDRRPPLDTDGCIALPNDELLALGPRLIPYETPVLVTRSIRWGTPGEIAEERRELRAALDRWVQTAANGDLHSHLSLYGEGFSYRGMNRDEWAAFRTQSISRAPPSGVEIDDVLLLADPEEQGLYLSRFRQAVAYGDRTVATVKRLYWRRDSAGILKIVAEDNG